MTTVIRRGFGIVLFFFVAGWLSKEDFGIFRTYSLILLMLSYLGNPGLDSHYITARKRENLNLFTMLQFGFYSSIILFFGLSIYAAHIGNLYNSKQLGDVLRLTAVFVFGEVLRRCIRSIAQKRLMFKELALAETLNVAVYSLLAIGLIYFFRSVWIYIVLFFIGNAIETGYLIIKLPTIPLQLLRRIFMPRWFLISVANIRDNLHFVLNVSLINLIGIYSGNAPILFMGILVSPLYVGLYFFASQLIGIPVNMFTSSIAQVLFPVFATSERQQTLEGIRRYTNLVTKLGIPFLLLYALLLQGILPMLFGGKWNDALPLVFYLVIYYGTSLLHHPISGIPFICRKPQWELGWNITTLILRIGALYLGLNWGFELAILIFCVISGIMNLSFYLMSIILLEGNARRYMVQLLQGLFVLVPVSLAVYAFQAYGLQLLGAIALGLIYLVLLYLIDSGVYRELRAIVFRS